MILTIGSAVSFRSPESTGVIPDDRQKLIQTIGGVIVQDHGRVTAGDVMSYTAVFDATNWALVKGYWTNRTLITFIDDTGASFANRRIVVKSWKPIKKFESKTEVTFEVWGV